MEQGSTSLSTSACNGYGNSTLQPKHNLKRKSLLENLGDWFVRICMHDRSCEFARLETKAGGPFKKRRWMFEWDDYNAFQEASVPNGGRLVNVRQMLYLDKGLMKLDDMNFFGFLSMTVFKLSPQFPSLQQLDLRGLKHLKSLKLEFIGEWVIRSETLTSVVGLGYLLELGFLQWLNIPSDSPCFHEISHLIKLQVLDFYGCGGVPDLNNLILLRVTCFRYNDSVTTIVGFNPNYTNLQFLDLSSCKRLQSCPGVGELVVLQELCLGYCSELKEVSNLQKLKRLRKLDVGLCSLLQGLPGLGNLLSLVELHASWCSSLEELPDMCNVKNMRILDLRYCKLIKSLPGLNELVCLRSLNMSGCKNLTQLPEMHKLTNLQSLELDPNAPLQSFAGLSDLISLRSLHIGIDEVHDGPDLRKLTMLKRLHIAGWQGQGFSSLAELVLLESAIVRHCKGLSVLPDLQRLSRLGELDLRRCEFEDMSGLSHLTSLQTLKIRDCDKLRALPDLRELAKLKELIVKRCARLRDVRGTVGLQNLQRLRGYPRLHESLLDPPRPRIVPVLRLFSKGLPNQQGPIACSQLRVLVCKGCPIQEFPDLANFPDLVALNVGDCVNLMKLTCTGLLSSMFRQLNVHGCMRLQALPDLTNSQKMQLVDVANSGVVLSAQVIQDMKARWPTIDLIME